MLETAEDTFHAPSLTWVRDESVPAQCAAELRVLLKTARKERKAKKPKGTAPVVDYDPKAVGRLLELRQSIADLESEERELVAGISADAEPLRLAECRSEYTSTINLNGMLHYSVQNLWHGATPESIRETFGPNTPEYFDAKTTYTITPDAAPTTPAIVAAMRVLIHAGLMTETETLIPKPHMIKEYTQRPEVREAFHTAGLRPRTMLKKPTQRL